MNIGYANAQGINDIEHWYKLEMNELKRRGHYIYEFNLRHKIPNRQEIKNLDFIHFHYCHVANTFKRMGIPFCISPHTNDIFPDNGKTLLKASSHKNCKFVTYQSFYHKRFFEEIGIEKPLVYLPMCCRVDLFKRKSPYGSGVRETHPCKIIAGGRLIPRKGLDRILPLVDNLQVFGDSKDIEYIDYLKSLNTTTNFVGHLSGTDLRDFYDDGWLYIFPARIVEDGNRDGIPNTLKEAMLMELQILASPVAGIPELENITLFSDWKNVNECIKTMPREPNKKGRREILNNFSPKSCIGRLLKGIENYG